MYLKKTNKKINHSAISSFLSGKKKGQLFDIICFWILDFLNNNFEVK